MKIELYINSIMPLVMDRNFTREEKKKFIVDAVNAVLEPGWEALNDYRAMYSPLAKAGDETAKRMLQYLDKHVVPKLLPQDD